MMSMMMPYGIKIVTVSWRLRKILLHNLTGLLIQIDEPFSHFSIDGKVNFLENHENRVKAIVR